MGPNYQITNDNRYDIIKRHDFSKLSLNEKEFYLSRWPTGVQEFQIDDYKDTYERDLIERLAWVRRSYVDMMVIFDLGIPDSPYYKEEGGKIVYYPNFGDQKDAKFQHLLGLKADFDYYSAGYQFFVKTVFDSLSGLLNFAYSLNLKKPDYATVCKKLDRADAFQRRLVEISEDKRFTDFVKHLRNDTAHNLNPMQQGSMTTLERVKGHELNLPGYTPYDPDKEYQVIHFGIHPYMSCEEITLKCRDMLEVLKELIDHVTKSKV